jgi:hypothetical protein
MPIINYSKAAKVKALRVPKAITIVGCGGTGSWAALFAAIAGVSRLVMFDDAKVTSTGLARLPFTPGRIGMPKVAALTALIRDYRPDIAVEAHEARFNIARDGRRIVGPLLNCSDSPAFARRLSVYAGQKGIRHVFAPYSGLTAGVFDHVPQGLKLDGTAGYWCGSSALAGALAITSVCGRAFNVVVDPFAVPQGLLSDKAMTPLSRGGL